MNIRSVVQSIGHAVPEKILSNADLEKIVDTNDEWITQRTGIKERRMSDADKATSHWSTLACEEALQRAGMTAEEIDVIVCGTVTGDMLFPATACLVQANIGAKRSAAFDVGAACAGFIHALSVADCMIRAGQFKNALVIGADTLTHFVDWNDRGTCILFGDGAGAVVLKGETDTDRGLLHTFLMADGTGAKHIDLQVGGSLHPSCTCGAGMYRSTIFMAGSEVYRFAVGAMGDACMKVLEMAGMQPSDIDLFVPHQANLRIIESAAKRLDLPDEKVFINVEKYGNTSGASVPLGLYEAEEQGRLKKGDIVMTVGFGAGLVWGANLIRW